MNFHSEISETGGLRSYDVSEAHRIPINDTAGSTARFLMKRSTTDQTAPFGASFGDFYAPLPMRRRHSRNKKPHTPLIMTSGDMPSRLGRPG